MIIYLVLEFEPIVGKRQARSISRLEAALAAVRAQIIVFWAVVPGPTVDVEREGRRWG